MMHLGGPQAKVEELVREQQSGSLDQAKHMASLEGQVSSLRSQLEGKEAEVKRFKAEQQMERKRLEKVCVQLRVGECTRRVAVAV